MNHNKSIPVTAILQGAGTLVRELVEKKEIVVKKVKGREITTQQTVFDDDSKPVMVEIMTYKPSTVSITRMFSSKELFYKIPGKRFLNYPKNATEDQILNMNLLQYHFYDLPEVQAGLPVTFTIEKAI